MAVAVDGIIEVGHAPEHWQFTADRFQKDSYLWRDGSRIIVSLITAASRGKGYFSHLVRSIEGDGLRVAIPTPSAQMRAILSKWGFVMGEEVTLSGDVAEVWMRP